MPKAPNEFTPDEIAELEKTRTISDAELLKQGAEYTLEKDKNNVRLEPTEEQINRARKKMEGEQKLQNRQREQDLLFVAKEELGLESLEGVPVFCIPNLNNDGIEEEKFKKELMMNAQALSPLLDDPYEHYGSKFKKVYNLILQKNPTLKNSPFIILKNERAGFEFLVRVEGDKFEIGSNVLVYYY